MTKKSLISVTVIFIIELILFFFLFHKEQIDINDVDCYNIQSFDLILSKGQSAQSKLVGLFNLSINDYSHVGILFKKDNKIFVLHATPDGTKTNSIRFDDLQTFLDLSNVSAISILRPHIVSQKQLDNLNAKFQLYKGTKAPFDYKFNNMDRTKIYCSELVYIIFKSSEVTKFEELDLSKPIYPSQFLNLKDFTKIN